MDGEQVCKVAFSCLVINDEGEMRICRQMEPIGNIKDTLPSEAWNSEKAERVRCAIKKCTRDCRILNCNYLDHE